MQAFKKSYQLERHFVVKVLFLLVIPSLVYGKDTQFCENVEDNVCSWYILDITQILQNATNNIIVSPSNIKALLQQPLPIDVRIGSESSDKNAIFTESKEILNNAENLEMFYNCKIEEMPFKKRNSLVTTFDNMTISINNVKHLDVIVLNKFSFKETLQINFKYTLNVTYHTIPDSITVPAVETTENLKYLDSQILDAKILELPYSNNFSMFILLPHTKQGVDEMINNLGYEQLKRIEWMMEERRVNVILPTFKYNFMTNMREHIQKNSEQRFDVDFYSTFGVESNKINFYQLTTVEFNGSGKAIEEGYSKTPIRKYERFHVDRPFAFYIKSFKTIVSIGKVINPMH